MRCPKKDQIVAYADGEIEDAVLHEHIESCQKCQAWLGTYRVLQRVGNEINPTPERIPPYQIPPALEAAMAEQTAAIRRTPEQEGWKILTAWLHSRQRPALAMGSAVALLILVGIVVWTIFQKESPGTPFTMAGVSYRAWGEKASLGGLQRGETPPALQSPQVSRHLGFLTPALTYALQHPKPTDDAFWKALSNALAEQKITLPPSVRTLVIEASLVSALQAKREVSNREIWVLFYQDKIVLIRWAE